MIIKGIPSGDGECWCFLVDKKTFTEVSGKPPEKYDLGRTEKGRPYRRNDKGSPYRYMLNPATLIDQFDKQLGGKVVILSVEAEAE